MMNADEPDKPPTLQEREYPRSAAEALQTQLEIIADSGYCATEFARTYERTVHDKNENLLETLTPGCSWPPDPAEAIATLESLQRDPKYRDAELRYGFRNEDGSRYSFTWAYPYRPHAKRQKPRGRGRPSAVVYASGCGQEIAQVTVADIVEQPTLLLPSLRVEDGYTLAADWTMCFGFPGKRPIFGRAVHELDEPTGACIAESVQALWCQTIAYREAKMPGCEIFMRLTLHRHRRGAPLPELREMEETFPELGPDLMFVFIQPTVTDVNRGSFSMRTTNAGNQSASDAGRMIAAILPMMTSGIFRSEDEHTASTEVHGNS